MNLGMIAAHNKWHREIGSSMQLPPDTVDGLVASAELVRALADEPCHRIAAGRRSRCGTVGERTCCTCRARLLTGGDW